MSVRDSQPVERKPPAFPKKKINFLIALLITLIIWFLPHPEGLTTDAWHMFAIFVGTIYAVITQPFPLGVTSLVALAALTMTKLLTFQQAFSKFSSEIVWLIVFAFFVARGIIKTGLGKRISYYFMIALGKHTLGLSYGLVATDLILAPAIPSITARSGGVIFPILKAISSSCGSEPLPSKSAKKVGSFLTKVSLQSTCITSAMFLTGMAANPLIAKFAEDVFECKGLDIQISWGTWAIAAIVPGLVSLILVPLIIYKLFPPELKETPDAPKVARAQLKEMGKISRNEWIMIVTFFSLITLWALAKTIGINPAISACTGLSVLLLTNVLTWPDIKNETAAWETMVWFGVLFMMAAQLNEFGMTKWFGDLALDKVQHFHWVAGFGILALIYFYAHYFFASNLAHVGAMYVSFLVVAISLGAPPLLSALILGFFSNLFGGLTPYSSGPAAILYDGKYVEGKEWWKAGFIMSAVNIIIWLGVGSIYWKLLNLW